MLLEGRGLEAPGEVTRVIPSWTRRQGNGRGGEAPFRCVEGRGRGGEPPLRQGAPNLHLRPRQMSQLAPGTEARLQLALVRAGAVTPPCAPRPLPLPGTA